MVSLCRNHPEDFGPHSTLHPHLPTSCFLDVIVVPLPTWILSGLLLMLLPRRMDPRRRRRASSILKPTKPIEHERTYTLESNTSPQPALHTRILTTVYYATVFAMVAMASVELGQLLKADVGVGLLPFNYVGSLAVVLNRLKWKARATRIENAVYWVLLGTVLTVKVAVQVIESDQAAATNGQNVRIYSAGKSIIVISVMIGLSSALSVLEFAGWTGLKYAV